MSTSTYVFMEELEKKNEYFSDEKRALSRAKSLSDILYEKHFSGAYLLYCKIKVKKKRLPLETKNTQNHENRRLGLTESLHMQHCSLQGRVRPSPPHYPHTAPA